MIWIRIEFDNDQTVIQYHWRELRATQYIGLILKIHGIEIKMTHSFQCMKLQKLVWKQNWEKRYPTCKQKLYIGKLYLENLY